MIIYQIRIVYYERSELDLQVIRLRDFSYVCEIYEI